MERLKAKLKQIRGIGDAKADEIIKIVQSEQSNEAIIRALEHLEAGHVEQAKEILEKAR